MANEVARVKRLFFSSKEVRARLDPATHKALTKFGAYVRRRIKSALKYKDGPARPGQPPHVHRSKGFTVKKSVKGKATRQAASPLRELMFFSYDPQAKSVVIGPAIGGSRSGAPRTLEEGGTARVDGRTVTVRQRPVTRPAFQLELTKVGGDFRNIAKG